MTLVSGRCHFYPNGKSLFLLREPQGLPKPHVALVWVYSLFSAEFPFNPSKLEVGGKVSKQLQWGHQCAPPHHKEK